MTAHELHQIRTSLKLSQKALAGRLGVARNSLSRWELGQWPIPTAIALAVAYLAKGQP